MKTRLAVVLVSLMAGALGGCVTDEPRPSGNLKDGTFYMEIGKPPPGALNPNCPVQ